MSGLKKRSWSGVTGSTTVEADTLGEDSRVALGPFRSADLAGRQCDEVELTFTSSGYDDPGKYDGPWESSYPADRDEERMLVSAVLAVAIGHETTSLELPAAIVKILDNDPVVSQAIRDTEIDTGAYPDPPDDESRWDWDPGRGWETGERDETWANTNDR